MIILEENLKWHLEAFPSELFKYLVCCMVKHIFLYKVDINTAQESCGAYLHIFADMIIVD